MADALVDLAEIKTGEDWNAHPLPEQVVKLFHEALQEYSGEVIMAVFDHSEDQYRYSCFEKYFKNLKTAVDKEQALIKKNRFYEKHSLQTGQHRISPRRIP